MFVEVTCKIDPLGIGNHYQQYTIRCPAECKGRNVWVLTAYAVSGLALFGVLIYYVSAYITQ